MKRISNWIFYALVVFLMIWLLPWGYNFFADKQERVPFVLYSQIAGDFISTTYREGKGVVREDSNGKEYSQAEVDSLLPCFYVRQLMADERLPDSLAGTELSPKRIQMTNFVFKSAPRDINAPKIGLYPLLEGMSDRVELQMPDDVFRITAEGIEFINMEENRIEEEKSRKFTETMRKKGFVFPAKYIAGNPTTRKEYDEGYLLLDGKGQIFHLKCMKGRPYVRPVKIMEGANMKYLFVTEFRDRRWRGMATDEQGQLYVLTDGYELKKTGVTGVRPEKNAFTVFGNMFDWTVAVEGEDGITYFAIRSGDFQLLKKKRVEMNLQRVEGLHFTERTDKYVKPRIL